MNTETMHERCKSDPTLTYAEITAHVDGLAGLSRAELIQIGRSVCVRVPGHATKKIILSNIRMSLENRKGRQERTAV